MKKKCKKILFFCLIAVVISVSCTKSEPEITYGFINLVLYQSDDQPVEHFSFFIIPEDEDGIENLEELYLYHDREQLQWNIKSDEWLHSTHDGRDWIGTRSITAAGGSLPRGVFRAVLINKGGESTQRTFTYDGRIRFPFPELEISGGVYNVTSLWPVNRLVCYDSSGNYLTTVTLTGNSGSVSQLRLPSLVRSAALWAEDEANACSAFTYVVPIN
ncbi:MAG: hypothetical protein FWD40_00470 [Treponema sp.]|nr:hypothetical protein [Treponema sp.]